MFVFKKNIKPFVHYILTNVCSPRISKVHWRDSTFVRTVTFIMTNEFIIIFMKREQLKLNTKM